MGILPEAVTALMSALGKLPGIGPRSAERIALHVVQADAGAISSLADALRRAREQVRPCERCHALSEQTLCPICNDPRRDGALLCVVERAVDILSIEKAGTFHGKYHVLGGRISPLNGVQPEDLNVSSLEMRLTTESISEVVLALGTDVEGDATSHYLAKRFARPGVRITRIAHGLPAGTGLEYADHLTLSRALEGRREL